ncbi:MAG: hypothetical protein OXC93_16630 [Rhodospirillaceae bacterium]|nr:hypothetical protein [Rhodospirillaceae bacterium]
MVKYHGARIIAVLGFHAGARIAAVTGLFGVANHNGNTQAAQTEGMILAEGHGSLRAGVIAVIPCPLGPMGSCDAGPEAPSHDDVSQAACLRDTLDLPGLAGNESDAGEVSRVRERPLGLRMPLKGMPFRPPFQRQPIDSATEVIGNEWIVDAF